MPNQVFIEATIAEVTINDTLQFGVEWYLNRHSELQSGSRPTPTRRSGVATTPRTILGNNPLGASVASVFPGFSYALRTASTQVTLNALNAITKVNIVSTPSLTVLDNHQAVLQVGDEVPVASLQSATALGNTFTSVSYQNTGVILSITPHISDSGRVMLNLVQEVSNVHDHGNELQHRIRPSSSARSHPGRGQGRRSPDAGRPDAAQPFPTDNQIPVLGDIPIIGNAFKDKQDETDKTELLIMITPHVLRSSSEAREITEDYKRQLLEISKDAIRKPHSMRQTIDRTILDKD